MRLTLAFLCLFTLLGQRQPRGPAELEVLVTADPMATRIDGADVEVRPLDRPPYRGPRRGPMECKTENGRCRFNLSPGIYLLTVSKPGYFNAVDPRAPEYSEQITVQPLARMRLEAALIPGGSVSGTVYTEDGQPVRNAFLRARQADHDPSRVPLQRWTYAGTEGEFRLEDLPPGRYGLFLVPPEGVRFRGLQRSEVTGEYTGYAVQMFHPGLEEASWLTPVEIAPGLHLEHRTVVLRRMRVHSVSGTLLDSTTRQPLLEASVALRTGDEYGVELFAPRRVRADGSFEFYSLAPGEYRLLVYRTGREIPWIVPFRVHPASQPDLLLSVPQWHPLTVLVGDRSRLRFGGNKRLLLTAEFDTGLMAASIGNAGEIPLGALPPGRYRLSLESEDGAYLASARQQDMDVLLRDVMVGEAGASPVRVEIADETAEIEGTLIDSEGDPVTRGWVVLAPADPHRRARSELIRQLRVGTDGSFILPQVQPGEYLLLGLPSRPAGPAGAQNLWAQHERDALRFELRPGDRLPVGLPIASR